MSNFSADGDGMDKVVGSQLAVGHSVIGFRAEEDDGRRTGRGAARRVPTSDRHLTCSAHAYWRVTTTRR